MARPVAKAMAEHGPPGETILQRSALMQVLVNSSLTSEHITFILNSLNCCCHSPFQQEELNSSDCGWALLVTESDPHVLSCLLWTWLERLRVSDIAVFGISDQTSHVVENMSFSVLFFPSSTRSLS